MNRDYKNSQGKIDDRETKRDLDTVLADEIGQIGRHQIKSLLVLVLIVAFCGISGDYLFTAARIPTRCIIPECENTSVPADFTSSWIYNAIPRTDSGSFDNCIRFARNDSFVENGEQSCPAELFDQQILVVCEEHVYENQNSVVYDFDLACDEWRRTFIGFAKTIASFVGIPLAGFVSDRWGRRKALIFCIFNAILFNITRYWIRSYYVFIAFEFLTMALGGGLYSTSYVLALEMLGPKYRVRFGTLLSSTISLGAVILGAIAWALPFWKTLILVIYVPACLLIPLSFLCSESVRWYVCKGRLEEAEQLLRDIARINEKQLSDNISNTLKHIFDENKQKDNMKNEENEPWLIVSVFKHKPILLRCIIVPILWITFTVVYYGMAINSVNLSGNQYINFMAVTTVDIPGFIIASLLLDILGRRIVLSGAYIICGVNAIAYLFVQTGEYSISLTVYLIAKCSICVTIVGVYVYTAELFPTKYRHQLFAFSSMVGRIGSSIGPLVPAFGNQLPYIIFGFMSCLAGLLVFLLPETLGSTFPDTMEEASETCSIFHKKKKVKFVSG